MFGIGYTESKLRILSHLPKGPAINILSFWGRSTDKNARIHIFWTFCSGLVATKFSTGILETKPCPDEWVAQWVLPQFLESICSCFLFVFVGGGPQQTHHLFETSLTLQELGHVSFWEYRSSARSLELLLANPLWQRVGNKDQQSKLSHGSAQAKV